MLFFLLNEQSDLWHLYNPFFQYDIAIAVCVRARACVCVCVRVCWGRDCRHISFAFFMIYIFIRVFISFYSYLIWYFVVPDLGPITEKDTRMQSIGVSHY